MERQAGNEDPAGQLTREAVSLLGSAPAGTSAGQGIRPDEAGMVLKFLLQPDGNRARVTVEDILLRKYPALASVTLEDGLDERERAILSDEGARFVKDLEKLIRKEKGDHER